MNETGTSASADQDQTGFDLGTPPVAGGGYRVLARKYRPANFDHLIGQEAMVRTVSNAFETGRIPQAWILTGVRGVGKTTTARILARALELRAARRFGDRADHQNAVARTPLPGDHGKPPSRRAGDGRRVPHRRRRRPPDHRRRELRAGECALQGLHHRRSAHAVDRGLQCVPEDAGRAAAARKVHLRDHRNPQGADHRALALPAFRPAPRRRRRADRKPRRYCRARKKSRPSRTRCA